MLSESTVMLVSTDGKVGKLWENLSFESGNAWIKKFKSVKFVELQVHARKELFVAEAQGLQEWDIG